MGFLVGIIWIVLVVRRRRRHKYRKDNMSMGDYASTRGTIKPSRFNFKWPSIPFKRSNRQEPQPATQFSMPNNARRSQTSIMNEAMRAAYGSNASGYPGQSDVDEKNAAYNAEAMKNATIRQSLASWFKRSSRHHPLQLNAMSRWSRSSAATGNSQYAASQYSGAPGSNAPPMPDLTLQRAYTAGSMMTTSTTDISELPTEPSSVLTRGTSDAQALNASHWSASSIGGETGPGVGAPAVPATERMSAASWTSGARTTMQGGGDRLSQTTELSPPSYYFGSNRASEMGLSGSGTEVLQGGDGRHLTAMHQEVLGLYANVAAEEAMPTAQGQTKPTGGQ